MKPSGKDQPLKTEEIRDLMRDSMRWAKPKREGGLRQKLLASMKSVVTEFQFGGNVEERRHSVRLRCDHPVVCATETRNFEAVVINIGMPGMSLLVSESFKPGDRLKVATGRPKSKVGYDPVVCRVRWCKSEKQKYRVGLSFEGTPSQLASTWIPVLLAELGFRESMALQRRRAIRARARLPGEVSLGDRTVEVIAYNLSIGGALLGSETRLEEASFIELTFELDKSPLTISARIVSAGEEDGSYYVGVEFARLDSVQTQRLGALVTGLLRDGKPR